MSAICGICRRPPRQDDPMSLVQTQPEDCHAFLVGVFGIVPQGTLTVICCRDCGAQLRGEPPPRPKRWEVGTRVPHKDRYPGDDAAIDICGICRLAMRDGESPQRIRLTSDELDFDGDPRAAVRPGAYDACPSCVEHFRPAIRWRLQAQAEREAEERGLVAGPVPMAMVHGDGLM